MAHNDPSPATRCGHLRLLEDPEGAATVQAPLEGRAGLARLAALNGQLRNAAARLRQHDGTIDLSSGIPELAAWAAWLHDLPDQVEGFARIIDELGHRLAMLQDAEARSPSCGPTPD